MANKPNFKQLVLDLPLEEVEIKKRFFMTPARLAQFKEALLKRENEVLGFKAEEYTAGKDALQNLKEIADFTGQRPSEVALIFLLKHIQGITLAVRSGSYNWNWESGGQEGLIQRFVDSRNWLLLLAACLEVETKERQENKA
jgi:hypothetical protein